MKYCLRISCEESHVSACMQIISNSNPKYDIIWLCQAYLINFFKQCISFIEHSVGVLRIEIFLRNAIIFCNAGKPKEIKKCYIYRQVLPSSVAYLIFPCHKKFALSFGHSLLKPCSGLVWCITLYVDFNWEFKISIILLTLKYFTEWLHRILYLIAFELKPAICFNLNVTWGSFSQLQHNSKN